MHARHESNQLGRLRKDMNVLVRDVRRHRGRRLLVLGLIRWPDISHVDLGG